MTKEYMEKYSVSLAIRELQVKTTLRYHLIPVRMAKIQNTLLNVAEDVEKWQHLGTFGRNAN